MFGPDNHVIKNQMFDKPMTDGGHDRKSSEIEAILRDGRAYLGRRAASAVQLREVLRRKLRKRMGLQTAARLDPGLEAEIGDAVARLGETGWFDDARLAVSRTLGLTAKGFSASRIRQTLSRQGLDPDTEGVAEWVEPDDEAQARRFAERKRLGVFASGRREASRERDVRALVRAGFSPRTATRVLDDLASAMPDGTEHE